MLSRRDLLAAALAAPALRLPSRKRYDLILRGGTVFDGTGARGRPGDIAVLGGKVAAIGRLQGDTAIEELDVRGLAVAPGFIDIHSHADGTLFQDPKVESVIRQGVTTIVVGQDGSSRIPNRNGDTSVAEWFKRVAALPSSVNVATMVGLGTLRRLVVGETDREATADELARMTTLVETALGSGACGASTGLEYSPGAYARQDELIALCRPLAARKLPYATHMRNEDDRLLEAVDEAIAIAQGAGCPLQLSHLKTGGARNWSKIDAVFARLQTVKRDGLDVTFDRYPYIAWATGLSNLFPVWALNGGIDAFLRRLGEADAGPQIRKESLDKVALVGGYGNVLISDVSVDADKPAVGKRVDEWARVQSVDPYDATVGLLQRNRGGVSTVVFAMNEVNLGRFLAHPLGMVCSDGGAFALSGPAHDGHPHPRGLGTFPRILGRYVREQKVLTLEQAVYKMAGMPAERLRLQNRGKLTVGAAADLMVFDPATVADRATFEEPFQYPTGIPHVVVNGVLALRDGERVGKGAGQGLKPAGP